MNLRISRCMAMICLAGSCQMIRTLPDAVPLDFSCQAQIKAPTLYANNQPQTKITLILTPNNEGTQASSLTLTDWSLPEGMNGLLLDSEGKAITSDTPLAWGEHVWHYSPIGIGEHVITLHLREPYEEAPRLIELTPIKVLASEDLTGDSTGSVVASPVPFAVSAWMRACASEEHAQVHGGDKEVVALEIRLGDIPTTLQDAPFKLQRWQLPEGVRGVLENEAGERLEAFPLSTEAGTFFLSLEKGHQVQEHEEPLRLWVEVPGGVTQEKEVPLHWRQTSFPFDLTLTADPIQLFEHQKTPVTLTITPQDPHIQTTYTLDALTLSHGQLQGTGSGVVLATGAALAAGEHQFTFSWPNNNIVAETLVNIRLTVSNKQGDSRTLEQVLTVRPVQFSVNAWLRELSEEEQVTSGNQQGLAVEVRLEEVDESLRDKPFTLQDCVLPNGFTGHFINKDRERLRFFPLSAQEPNTFFLAFEPHATIRDLNPTINFQVMGPHRQLTAGQADCTLLQKKLFVASVEYIFNQIKPYDTSALASNMAHLRELDRLGRQGTLPEHIRRSLARIRPGLEEDYAMQEAVDQYGSIKLAVAHLCCENSLTDQEELILRRLVEREPDMLLSSGRRPLRVAAYRMNLDAVRVLLQVPQAIGQDVNTPTFPLLTGFISACYSDSRGNREDKRKFDAIFDALIEVSSIVNEKNGIGWTPLMEAVKAGDLNMVKKLVNKGAHVTAATTGEANYTVSNDCWVERYIFLFANKDTKGGQLQRVWQWTALHEAVSRNPNGACANFLRSLNLRWDCARAYYYRHGGSSDKIDTIEIRNWGFYVEN